MLEKDFVDGIKVKVNNIIGYRTFDKAMDDWYKASIEGFNVLENIKLNGGYLFIDQSGSYIVYDNIDKRNRYFYVNLKDVELYEENNETKEESLFDKVFQVHNEITLRNGDMLICLGKSYSSNENNDIYTDCYDENLKHGYREYCDIMKVVNPFTQEVIYEREEKIDWNIVEVDTPVLVRNSENEEWEEMKFAMYLHNANYKFFVFLNGDSKKTAEGIVRYKYCKLAK